MDAFLVVAMLGLILTWGWMAGKVSALCRNICCIGMIFAATVVFFVTRLWVLNGIFFVLAAIALILAEKFPKNPAARNLRRETVTFTQELIFGVGAIVLTLELYELMWQ